MTPITSLRHSKKLKWIILCLLSLACLVGCGESDDSSVPKDKDQNKVSNHLKGKWFRLDGGTIHLGESTEYTIDEIDDNMLEIHDKKRDVSFFAARFGSHQAGLSMTVSRPNYADSKGITGIGGIEVILQDLNDSGNRHQAQTEQDGSIDQDNLISSDYSVTIPETTTHQETQLECSITGEKDLAVITPALKGDYSFRTELIMNQDFVYGDYNTYTGKIQVTNVGDIDAEAVQYILSLYENSLLKFTNETILSSIINTIEPGSKKTIPIEFQTKFLNDAGLSDDYMDDTIRISLIDRFDTEWESYVPIRVYRKKVILNTADTRRNSNYNDLKGLIVFPDRYLKRLTSSTTYTFPMSRDKPYGLILSNLTAANEEAYSLGFGAACHSQEELSEFLEPNKDEAGSGNNTENTAITLWPNETYIGYIHKMDIDYFLLDMGSETIVEPVALMCLDSKSFYSINDTNQAGWQTLGNDDGRINPGESVRLNVGVTNMGTSTAYGVTTCLSLTGADDYVSIPESLSCSDHHSYPMGDIEGGETIDSNGNIENGHAYLNLGDYLLQVSDETPVGHEINLTATMTDAYDHKWTSRFSLSVEEHGAVLKYSPPPESIRSIDDRTNPTTCPTCNDDGKINPGERIRLNIPILNQGTSSAFNVSAEIALANQNRTDITIVQAQSSKNSYRNFIEPGQIVSCKRILENNEHFMEGGYGDFIIEFSENIPTGPVTFDLIMHDDLNTEWRDEFTLMVVP